MCACERMKRETEGKRKWVWRILRKQFTVIRKGKKELATTRPQGRRRSKVGAHIGVDISNVTLSDTTSVVRDFLLPLVFWSCLVLCHLV